MLDVQMGIAIGHIHAYKALIKPYPSEHTMESVSGKGSNVDYRKTRI